LALKIGNYVVEYSSDSYSKSLKSGEAIVDTSGKGNSFYFNSSATLYQDGITWMIPGIAIGGEGNDTYYIGMNEFGIIGDASTSSSDILDLYDYASNLTEFYSIEERHIFVQTYWGATALIIDGLNARGSIEKISFYDLSVSGSPDSMSSLLNSYKTKEDQTFDQLISNNLFRPSLMGVNSADEVRNIIEAVNENSNSKPLSLTLNSNYLLGGLRDYGGNLHGGQSAESRSYYKYQGSLDVNNDGLKEEIFTNKKSGRWATVSLDQVLKTTNYEEHQEGGITRVVGIYIDPLVTSGDVIAGSDHDSQRRFQNDLRIDNLNVKASGDYDNDGFQEVYWKTTDNTAYLRALMHADGNIQYANYQSEEQVREYLTSKGFESEISNII